MQSIHDFYRMKQRGEKIAVVTGYDFVSAQLLEKAGVDCVLVGDSAAMVIHGYPSTVHATMDMMVMHVGAVARGLKNTLIIGDLPFLSYRKSLSDTMKSVQRFIQAGAHCVKLEGVTDNMKTIRHIVTSGVPVMGHIGLTPQHIHQLGGFKVQGKSTKAAENLMEQAKACEEVGCFALVLECVPATLAKNITDALSIATIGIGAGPDTDGQVLVYHDLLGLQEDLHFKFVKRFLSGGNSIVDSIQSYVQAVKTRQFPQEEHCYASD